MRSRSAMIAALLSTLPTALAAQHVRRVGPSDFVVRRISDQTDSARVRRLLGAPDSITSSEHPYNVGARLFDWWYPQFRVLYNQPDTVSGIWIFRRGVATARGLQVGDSRERVRQLYGAPDLDDTDANDWVYHESADESQLHLFKVFFRGNTVRDVFVGWALD